MNVTNRINKIALLVLSFVWMVPAYTAEVDPVNPQVELRQAIENDFEQILRGRLAEFKNIDRIIEDLLLLVENNAITVNNKSAFSTNAKDLKDLIAHITQDSYLNVTPNILLILGVFSEAMIKHIDNALDNHMTDFPPFDPQAALTRYVPQEVTLPSMYNDLQTTTKKLVALTAKAKLAGMRWYNKAYRALDKHIIQPGNKYKLFSRAGKVGLLATLGLYLAYQGDTDYWWRKRWSEGGLGIGWPFRISNLGGNGLDVPWHKEHPLGWIGAGEKFFWEKTSGFTPLGALLFGSSMLAMKEELTSLKNWATIKADKFHNILKGGTYTEKAEDKFLVNPKVMFKDLVGLEHAKSVLSFIVKYMDDPERFDRAKLTPEKGYILTGPTRTGKSHIAEALAGEIKAMFKRKKRNPEDFNFFVLTASFVLTEGIDNIINRAKLLAPCVLFIDEIDLLGLQRVGGSPETLSRFLSSMSGCLENDPDKVVIMIAATNRPENLDHALRQRGRFGKEIRFEYPSYNDRKEFLTKKIGALANINAFNVDQLARETENRSFEDLNVMIKNAFQRGITNGEALTQEMLDKCLDEEVRHIINADETPPSREEQRLLAIHQAGHALSVMLLNGQEKLAKVTIKKYLAQLREEAVFEQFYQSEEQQQKKKIKYGRIYTYHTHDAKGLYSYEDKIKQCKIQLAGFAAEQIILGESGYSYHQEDASLSFDVAKSIVTGGLDISQMTDVIKTKYLEKAEELKERCSQEIHALLVQHKDKLTALADALYEKGTLTGAEVAQITGLPAPSDELSLKPCSDSECISHELGIQEVAA